MNREVESTLIRLTLYVTFSEKNEKGEDVKYRGSYNTEIHPGTSLAELQTIIEQGVYAAGFVKNAWYPLVSPSASPAPKVKTEIDAAKVLSELQDAFYANDNHTQGNLSYSEFFLTQRDVRIVNSSGVDVSFSANDVYVETAAHWRSPEKGEIEICDLFRFSLPTNIGTAADMLKDRVSHLFTVAEQKSVAKPTPQVNDINILLTGQCLADFFTYYWWRTNAALVYQNLSTVKEGDQVQGGTNGDCLTLTLDPQMEGSSYSCPYDDYGLPLLSHQIIKDGKLVK
jgi:predicted Zn-dependent protease